MFCELCGAKIDDGVKFCECCGNKISAAIAEDNVKKDGFTENAEPNSNASQSNGKCVGEKMVLTSTREANLSIIHHRISSKIEFGEDRLYIQTIPEKFNLHPVVFYTDIVAVTLSKKWFAFSIFVIVLSFIAVFFATGMNPLFALLAAAIEIFIYKNTKITIHLRNGTRIDLYDSNKSCAEAFTNKLKSFTSL